MKQVTFDFEKIESIDDFYRKAVEKMDLPDYFGNNLDALCDSLTGGIELPMDIRFTNLNPEQLEQFYDVIVLFEDAAINLDDVLYFEYSLRTEDDLFFNDIEF